MIAELSRQESMEGRIEDNCRREKNINLAVLVIPSFLQVCTCSPTVYAPIPGVPVELAVPPPPVVVDERC